MTQMVTEGPCLHPSSTGNIRCSVGNGAASAGVSHPVSRYPWRSRFLKEVHFFLYDRPSVLGWMSGLGTDPTTEQQELRGKLWL